MDRETGDAKAAAVEAIVAWLLFGRIANALLWAVSPCPCWSNMAVANDQDGGTFGQLLSAQAEVPRYVQHVWAAGSRYVECIPSRWLRYQALRRLCGPRVGG